MRAAFFILLVGLGACADIPVLEDRIDSAARDAPYPALINIDPLVAQASTPTQANAIVRDMNARIANLRARANGLRRPVIPAAVRARMARGVSTSALR